jgi:PAS domain S-box-containing protein
MGYPGTLFFLVVVLSAWYGGVGPCLLATAFSDLTFHYYFLQPIRALGPKPPEMPRLLMFTVSSLLIGLLSAAQRRAKESIVSARDDLDRSVQDLQRSNEALHAESRERRQTEEALRRSESYLAEAQRLTHTGSGAWSVPGWDALYLSEEWNRIYGFDPKQGLSAWEDRLQRMHPEDQAKVQEAKDRAASEKSDYEVDHRIILPDGTVRYTHTVGHPVLNASGDVEQFVCTMMDVTERKRAEEALRRNEAYLTEAQRLSHTGSFGWNTASGEIHWSEETYNIFELDRAVKPTLELVFERTHPDDKDLVEQTIGRAIEAREDFDLEHRLLMPDSSIKHVHVLARAWEASPGNLEFVGAVTDVTDRNRAEEALRSNEAYLAEGQKLSRTGTWACNIATREMIHSSQEHRQLFGLTPDKIGTPQFEEFFQRIHPDDQGATAEGLERAIIAARNVEANFRVVLPDGTTRYMYGIGRPLVKRSGNTGEFVGAVMDITAAKQAEMKLRESEAYLADAQRLSQTGSWAWNPATASDTGPTSVPA